VNWDLIPQNAVSTITLLSGSNPVFGLNTLGGALSLRTKSGHDNPGTELEAYGGSFGRRSFEGETGGEFGNFDYFFAGLISMRTVGARTRRAGSIRPSARQDGRTRRRTST